MTVIAIPAEAENEPRVALSPETAKKFKALGCEIRVQSGAGRRSYFTDAAYQEGGASIVKSREDAIKGADILLKVGRPTPEEVAALKQGAIVVAMLDPFGGREELDALAKAGVSAFSMELLPRTTRAQVMDVLSSQANLAGYKAVIDAASEFSRAMPMMMTAAGTVPAARVFIMGAGVAGLQAIATARRLGAVVSATDVRPASKTEVESLAAKFIAIEDEEFKQAQTAGGYAKEMSEDYKRKQAELVAKHIQNQDIVITTALIPGRPAPKLISAKMVESMRPGSIILDMAVERGGNCELSEAERTVEHNGVKIMGISNLSARIPGNSSSLYARNLYAFVEPMIDRKENKLAVKWDDELISGTLISRGGSIVHPTLTQGKAA